MAEVGDHAVARHDDHKHGGSTGGVSQDMIDQYCDGILNRLTVRAADVRKLSPGRSGGQPEVASKRLSLPGEAKVPVCVWAQVVLMQGLLAELDHFQERAAIGRLIPPDAAPPVPASKNRAR